MKITVTESMFRQAFRDAGRADQFTNEALDALFEYLEDCERDTGEEWELDVIALCCDFSEDLANVIGEMYGVDMPECADMDDAAELVADYLEGEGALVARLKDGYFLYRQH